ncbi:MAG TPA: GntR family transcriptional regulator [Steroidobacteraceae bacterium]|nr:GntR family transcriptional regulator [Steroidobacteraceae bacterium]
MSTRSGVKKRSQGRTHQPSVSERVAGEICAAVREGQFAPGERLTEAQLTARFGVSRGPVREALRRLEADGILVFEKNRGVSVRRLNRDDFVQLLEVREALESLAARLVATAPHNAAPIEELHRLHKQMDRALERGDVDRYSQVLYVRFHTLLIESSESPILIRQWRQLNLDVLRQQFQPLVTLDLVRSAQPEHAGLLAALARRDAIRAEACARRHISEFTEHVRRLPDRVFRASPPDREADGRPMSERRQKSD